MGPQTVRVTWYFKNSSVIKGDLLHLYTSVNSATFQQQTSPCLIFCLFFNCILITIFPLALLPSKPFHMPLLQIHDIFFHYLLLHAFINTYTFVYTHAFILTHVLRNITCEYIWCYFYVFFQGWPFGTRQQIDVLFSWGGSLLLPALLNWL